MRILIVEDEQKLAEALKRGLAHKGYAVDIVGDGEEAFRRILLYRNEYDVIILDLMLPGMSGDNICRQVRAEGVTTPIIILSARTEIDSKVDLLQCGADDYVVKPFSFDELCARIEAIRRRPQEMVPTVLTVRDIEINIDERTVKKDQEPIELTLKEFVMLEYFMRHPNTVLSREDILDHLWDFNFSSLSNVVDVHVKNLRKKLDPGNSEGLLETVRGVGYRLKG